MMTAADRAKAWEAVWLPFGGVHSVTGVLSSDQGFPGQWFQAESSLHYNWHRHYDSSVGRYTQPDPLGFVDGPSVYGYALGNPYGSIDPDGQKSSIASGGGVLPPPPIPSAGQIKQVFDDCWKNFCSSIGGGSLGSGPLAAVGIACRAHGYGSGGGGRNNNDDDDCEKEWREARERCRQELMRPRPRKKITGGYSDITNCSRGLVSERCGGNKVEHALGKPRKRNYNVRPKKK